MRPDPVTGKITHLLRHRRAQFSVLNICRRQVGCPFLCAEKLVHHRGVDGIAVSTTEVLKMSCR